MEQVKGPEKEPKKDQDPLLTPWNIVSVQDWIPSTWDPETALSGPWTDPDLEKGIPRTGFAHLDQRNR